MFPSAANKNGTVYMIPSVAVVIYRTPGCFQGSRNKRQASGQGCKKHPKCGEGGSQVKEDVFWSNIDDC